jgi:hypothetical protein
MYIRDVPNTFIHATALAASADVWHQRLGHVNYGALQHMQRANVARNFEVDGIIRVPAEHCAICLEGKHQRDPFPSVSHIPPIASR